jgi:hypothetical protein
MERFRNGIEESAEFNRKCFNYNKYLEIHVGNNIGLLSCSGTLTLASPPWGKKPKSTKKEVDLEILKKELEQRRWMLFIKAFKIGLSELGIDNIEIECDCNQNDPERIKFKMKKIEF